MPVNFAEVLTDMGTFMWHAGKLKEGEEALETAEKIMDDKDVHDPAMKANVLQLLGIMTSFDGVSERKRSMKLRHEAKAARHQAVDETPRGKMTKDDWMEAAMVEHDMAFAYVQQEDFEDAAKLMKEMIKQYEKWGTEKEIPYMYSHYYQIMSLCLMAAKKPVEAVQHITHCAELLTEAGSVMHPMT